MSKMRVAQISKAKEDFELVERDIPSPGPGQVRIKVQACGVCHSDLYDKEGLWPGLQFPGIPGHEVAGVINEVGPARLAATGAGAYRAGLPALPATPRTLYGSQRLLAFAQ
jgi:D-arabinose 1-dehydrogenase-like Zn-dependent alcohol dehydrogenase